MKPTFFLSCLESRIEDSTSWYSKFEIGPFPSGQALTVANSLRRTLLSQRQGVFLMGVEIEGAIHEYSRIKGLKESILDVLLNLRQLSLVYTEKMSYSNDLLIGYFDIQGPGVITALNLQFPKGIECINTNQVIGTLTRDGSFRGRFLISIEAKPPLFGVGDPIKINENLEKNFSKTQWLSLNPVINPVRRVNYSVEQFKDIWEQKEVAILELWTNGSVHPKQALQDAINNLAQLFFSISWIGESAAKSFSPSARFFELKNDLSSFYSNKRIGKTTFSESSISSIRQQISENNVVSPHFDEIRSERVSALLDLDIANLNLSLKIFLILKKLNIQNIGNLLKFIKSNAVSLQSFTQIERNEIHKSLNEFGLSAT